jgi:hypothetical protein
LHITAFWFRLAGNVIRDLFFHAHAKYCRASRLLWSYKSALFPACIQSQRTRVAQSVPINAAVLSNVRSAFRTNGLPVAGTTIYRSADEPRTTIGLEIAARFPLPQIREYEVSISRFPGKSARGTEEPGANGNRAKRPSRLHIFKHSHKVISAGIDC